MISAIVYTSSTGHTRQYAKLLADEIPLPWYDLSKGVPAPKNREIIYMGWLFAGSVQGYAKAANSHLIKAVCASGMGPLTDTLIGEIREKSHIPADVPIFYLQGGFDMAALNPAFRAIMSVKNKSIAAGLRKVDTMNEQEAATYKMTQGAYSAVDKKNLASVIAWYNDLKS